MKIGNQTEEIMHAATISDTATPRYGYDPKVMFAATRAYAERRALETTATAIGRRPTHSAKHLIRRLFTRLPTSSS